MSMQPSPQTPPPSVRFYHSGRNNLGVILAIVAATFTFAINVWPIAVPQGQGSGSPLWAMATRTAGVIYVLAFFAADRKPGLAKALLVGGAGIQLASAIVTGLVIN